ncbi:hypothetical protein K1719_023567 [Acacia pycnantha]|nr:hypothetical protein K1719_023567 [Acacia pycnantha]
MWRHVYSLSKYASWTGSKSSRLGLWQLEHFVSPIIKLSLLSIIAFLTVVLVAHAALPPKIYLKSMLPNTPMPELIEDLLPSIG